VKPAIPQSEAKLPYQLGSHLSMTTPHTPHRFGYANLTTTATIRTNTNVRLFKRAIDRMFDHYILLSGVSKLPVQNTPDPYTNNTSDRNFSNFRESTTIDIHTLSTHLKWTNVQNLNTLQYSKQVSTISPYQELVGTGQPCSMASQPNVTIYLYILSGNLEKHMQAIHSVSKTVTCFAERKSLLP